jgi:hypothetical protein
VHLDPLLVEAGKQRDIQSRQKATNATKPKKATINQIK